jgi:phage-related holin
MKFSVLIYITLLTIKLNFLPNITMLGWVFFAVLVDFLTGVLKAKLNKQILTSGGFRQTSIKCLQYIGLIVGGIIIGNAFEKQSDIVTWVNDGLLIFIIYVEVYSIFENLYAMNPNSKVAKMIFKPAMRILTIGLEKHSLNNAAEKAEATKLVVIGFAFVLFTGCRVVKPEVNSSFTSKDTTITNYKSVNAEYKGATVANSINQDSLFKAFAKLIANSKSDATRPMNMDSLLTAFKAGLKQVTKDTIVVTDAQTKVQLKYWYDEFGKLQMTCSSKDQTIQMMIAEITRLTKEVTKEKKVEVVYKMPNWGWVVIGIALACFLGVIIVFFLVLKGSK